MGEMSVVAAKEYFFKSQESLATVIDNDEDMDEEGSAASDQKDQKGDESDKFEEKANAKTP
jgi:hypothetical protein